jgi:hypothetical protein
MWKHAANGNGLSCAITTKRSYSAACRATAWEQLWDDYRLCVAMGVYIAVEYCRGHYNEDTQWVWLPMLQKALTACDDLHCAELWA